MFVNKFPLRSSSMNMGWNGLGRHLPGCSTDAGTQRKDDSISLIVKVREDSSSSLLSGLSSHRVASR